MTPPPLFLKRALLVLLLCCCAGPLPARQPARNGADRQVLELIGDEAWFELENRYARLRERLSPNLRLRCEAELGSRFGRLEESCAAIGRLLNEDPALTADPATAGRLLGMLIGNLRMLSAYAQAAELLEWLSPPRESAQDPGTLATLRWFRTMEANPATTIERPEGEVRLPLAVVRHTLTSPLDGSSKEIREFRTEAELDGITESFIFDTGCAGANFVSADFAERHRLRTLCDSLPLQGVGGGGRVRLATTDSMRLGPLIVRNPYFMVFERDERAELLHHVDAVLGTEIMRLMGQIELRPGEETILLPASPAPVPRSGRNLSLDVASGQYLLQVGTNDETALPMLFDTGNSTTGLSQRYFALHRRRIERTGTRRETASGGFGGVIRGTGYDLRDVRFTIGNGSRTLPQTTVNADFDSDAERNLFGSPGVDLYKEFDRIVFDLRQMFVMAE